MNEATAMSQESNLLRICSLCHQCEALHRGPGAADLPSACPVFGSNEELTGWHPSNRFTPVEATSTARPTADPTDSNVPKGCLPFGLAKALTGHPLETREGGEARAFRMITDDFSDFTFCHSAQLFDLEKGWISHLFNKDGRYSAVGLHAFDLFLKAPTPEKQFKSEDFVCGCGGSALLRTNPGKYTIQCSKCDTILGPFQTSTQAMAAWKENAPLCKPAPAIPPGEFDQNISRRPHIFYIGTDLGTATASSAESLAIFKGGRFEFIELTPQVRAALEKGGVL